MDVGNFENESKRRIELEGKSQELVDILNKYLELLSEIKIAKIKQEDVKVSFAAGTKQSKKTVNLLNKVLVQKQQSENPLGSLSLVKKSSGLPLYLIENSPKPTNENMESNVMESLKKSFIDVQEDNDSVNRLLRKENNFYKNTIQYLQNELDHYRDIKLDNNKIIKTYVDHQNKLYQKEVINFANSLNLVRLFNDEEYPKFEK
jgi:hypothetical protein